VAFDTAHPAVRSSLSQKQRRGLDMALAIYMNEGLLDACRAADAAFISTGIQQWSLHTNREFSVLLQMFKDRRPDQYDLNFGLYGLQPKLWAPESYDPWSHQEREHMSPTQADIQTANADYFAGGSGTKYPDYVTLFAVKPGEDAERLPKPAVFPSQPTDPRAVFFGAYHPLNKQNKEITSVVMFRFPWSGRIRMASLCSVPYCGAQLELGSYRFTRIQKERATYNPRKRFAVGTPREIEELITSEFAAATLLDEHINMPQKLVAAFEDAIKRTKGTTLDTAWLLRFGINFMAARDIGDKANRDDRILKLHDKGLNPGPNTFNGW
jgi:hypothetical protein